MIDNSKKFKSNTSCHKPPEFHMAFQLSYLPCCCDLTPAPLLSPVDFDLSGLLSGRVPEREGRAEPDAGGQNPADAGQLHPVPGEGELHGVPQRVRPQGDQHHARLPQENLRKSDERLDIPLL